MNTQTQPPDFTILNGYQTRGRDKVPCALICAGETVHAAVFAGGDLALARARARKMLPALRSVVAQDSLENVGAIIAAEPPWRPVDPGTDWFSEILAIVETDDERWLEDSDRSRLNDEAVRRISGCIGYALREVLRGEDLSEPEMDEDGFTLRYNYDATKTRSDDPDFLYAFELAEQYIIEGSPVRKTNRAGAGTKGTRLVEGIGRCDVRFYVR